MFLTKLTQFLQHLKQDSISNSQECAPPPALFIAGKAGSQSSTQGKLTTFLAGLAFWFAVLQCFSGGSDNCQLLGLCGHEDMQRQQDLSFKWQLALTSDQLLEGQSLGVASGRSREGPNMIALSGGHHSDCKISDCYLRVKPFTGLARVQAEIHHALVCQKTGVKWGITLQSKNDPMVFSSGCRDMQVCVALPMLVPETINTHIGRERDKCDHKMLRRLFLTASTIGPLFYSQMWHFSPLLYIPPACSTQTWPAFPLSLPKHRDSIFNLEALDPRFQELLLYRTLPLCLGLGQD